MEQQHGAAWGLAEHCIVGREQHTVPGYVATCRWHEIDSGSNREFMESSTESEGVSARSKEKQCSVQEGGQQSIHRIEPHRLRGALQVLGGTAWDLVEVQSGEQGPRRKHCRV